MSGENPNLACELRQKAAEASAFVRGSSLATNANEAECRRKLLDLSTFILKNVPEV